jgi:elongation of very long chain fatty acids protein 6
MYFYYFLMAIRCKPKWFNPKWITLAQITQMVIGATVSFFAFLVVGKEGCWATFENNTGVLIMYVSYFFLFVQFFLQRYGVGFNFGTTKKEKSA